jgi:acyl-CoA thioester hydrolase
MARINIDLPGDYNFSTTIPVRITDLNYGGHVGNDAILSIIHEARMQFLNHFGYSENNLAGAAMIMGDVAISYKNELFYGDTLHISVAVSDITKVSFDLLYLLETERDGQRLVIAKAKTGMICFDYKKRKVVSLPEEVRQKWLA